MNKQTFRFFARWAYSVALLCLPWAASVAQPEINLNDYRIEQADIERARQLINTPLTAPLEYPNTHPDAQWFPTATLGLFMHWGIHSVDGVQPSWNMIKGFKYAGKHPHTPKQYYDLAKKFAPTKSQVGFLKAAKEAGFTYAVMTARHHDGYALWPSKYGLGTKQYLGDRDLMKEYVDACHEAGLRVGFYYSPQDWHYPGSKGKEWFFEDTRKKELVIDNPEENQENYVRFLGYVMRQIEELLTNYGRIDVLWLDGMWWPGITEVNNDKIYAWIRSLQPGIVINDRWANVVDPDNPDGTALRIGDFTTPFECGNPLYIPSKWWEHEDLWTSGGGWGYDKEGKFRSMGWFFTHFVQTRSLGGNFLVNAGPAPDGDMHPNYYKEIEKLKQWMAYGKESLYGTGVTPGPELSNVPLTSRGDSIVYAHLLQKSSDQVSLITARKPVRLTLLRTGEQLSYICRDGYLYFKVDKSKRKYIDDVVKIEF